MSFTRYGGNCFKINVLFCEEEVIMQLLYVELESRSCKGCHVIVSINPLFRFSTSLAISDVD